MTAMLLAAGFGTRFQPHTNVIAKPSLPFFNLPMFSYPLFHLRQTGLDKLVINTHHLPKTISSSLASFSDQAEFSTEVLHETEILGSGGGILNAKSILETADHFFVINADVVFFTQKETSLRAMYDAHVASGALATMLTLEDPDAILGPGGVDVDGDNNITNLGTTIRTENTKHFGGVFIFSKRIFDFMPSKKNFHIFTDCLNPAQARGEKIKAYHTRDMLWLSMSSEAEYLKATQTMLRQMWGGTNYGKQLQAVFKSFNKEYDHPAPNIWLGQRSKIDCIVSDEALVLVGDGTEIHQPVGIHGFAVFGSNVTVSQGFIENSVVASGLSLHEMVAVRDQLLLHPEQLSDSHLTSPSL